MDGLRNFLTHRITVRVCQIAIGLIFGAAGLAKVGDLKAFAGEVHNFRLVPVAAENLVAMTLPWVELVAALALILGIRVRAAAALTAVLMLAFTLGVASAVARGLDFECGCFGTSDASQVGLRKLLENTGMLVVSVVAVLRPRG